MVLELCWASRDERRRQLAGDELVPQPMGAITHAITIDAPPGAVWPWLVQMGSGRAGWYAYDQIDNSGVPSARRVIPELQHVAAGDVMPWLPGARDGFIVRAVVPERALVLVEPLQSATADSSAASDTSLSALRASWTLALEPLDHGRTRLITRARLAREWLAPQPVDRAPSHKPIFIERVYSLLARMPWPLMLLVVGFVHYLMESRMLRGIKRRAEQRQDEEHANTKKLRRMHGESMKAASLFKAVVALGVAGLAYVKLVRPWYRRWGATASVNQHKQTTEDGSVFARWRRWMYQGKRPNWLARLLIRVDAAVSALGLTGNSVVTLEVIGRTSGRVITLPLVVAIVDGQRYLVSMLGTDAQWVRNVQAANGRVALRNGGRRAIQLEEVPVEQRAPILKAYLKRAAGARPHIPVDKDAPLMAFELIAGAYPVFRVVPREEAPFA